MNVTQAPLATVFEQLDWQPPQGVQAGELGDLTLKSEFSFRAEPREIRVSKLSAEVFGMQVSGDGTLTGADELAGNVTIAEFTPNSAVQSLLRASVPPKVDVSALGKLALATRFDANLTSGRASLANLKATVFGAAISGNLEALPGQQRQRVPRLGVHLALRARRVREGVRGDAAADARRERARYRARRDEVHVRLGAPTR